MNKFWKKVHLWLSIPVGLVFCFMSITGAMLVFEDEITEMVYRNVSRIADPGTDPLSIEAIQASVAPTLDDGVEIGKIITSDSPDRAYKVTLSQPRGAALFVDQYTGQVLGNAGRLEFFSHIRMHHRWLGGHPKNGKSVGKTITGWCTAASFFILLSGLIIWWPKNKSMLAARLKVKRRPAYAFWYTLHCAAGFYALIVLLIMVLTGLSWSFPGYRDVVVTLFGSIPFKAVHTGAWLGLTGKILWFIAALVGAMLPLTGYYFWIKSLKKKNNGK